MTEDDPADEISDIETRIERLAEKYFRDGNDHLQNAIGVSFLEHLNLQNAQWAWELLGPILQREYLQLVDAGMAKPLPYRR